MRVSFGISGHDVGERGLLEQNELDVALELRQRNGSMMNSITRKRSRLLTLSGVIISALTLTACGSAGGPVTQTSDGGAVEMWVRASSAAQSQALVDAYNLSHDQQVELTVVPTDNYLQKVGVAAGGNQLPCLMASDVVYMPNFIEKNLYLDITERVDGLAFKDDLAGGHMSLASSEGVTYGVPHTVAVSAIFQNDILLERAGIDPDVVLTSLQELADNATKVAALGNGTTGLYYTGNNAGSISFTHFPAIWASGGEALSDDGYESLLASPESIAVFQAFNDMFKSGATADSVRNESGATRNEVFAQGNTGYMLASNSVLDAVPETENLKIGVMGMPGIDGGVSAFVGGDSIGITASCNDANGAWAFLEWTLSEEGQIEVFAKANQLTVRSDLADNEYAAMDPRVVRLNELVGEGDTPKALNYGQTFNDPNGPALATFRDALFGGDAAAALRSGNDAITNSLGGN